MSTKGLESKIPQFIKNKYSDSVQQIPIIFMNVCIRVYKEILPRKIFNSNSIFIRN